MLYFCLGTCHLVGGESHTGLVIFRVDRSRSMPVNEVGGGASGPLLK